MLKLLYILFLLFVSGLKCKLHQFEYTEEEDNITHLLVLESEDADLSCSKPASLKRFPGYLSWEKSVLVPAARNIYHKIDEISGVTPPGANAGQKMAARFEGEFTEDDPSRYQYKLYLPSNATEPRDGRYTCFFHATTDAVAYGRFGIKVYYVRVIVDKPSETITHGFPSGAPDGSSLSCFEPCDDADQFYFTTRWYYFPTRINAPSRDYGSHIRLYNPKREHKSSSAIYYCSIEELQYTKRIRVNVMYLPDVYMTHTSEIYKSEGDLLRLVCLVDSYPSANINWSGNDFVNKAKRKDLVMVDATFDKKSKFLRSTPCITKSTLEIESVEADSFGKYICSACNLMGCSNNTITVKRTITNEENRKP